MASKKGDAISEVAAYYTRRLAEHGPSAQAVDWNGEDSQVLRFQQLARVIERDSAVSVNDLGCGYGALFEHLVGDHPELDYRGFDVAPTMVEAAEAHIRDARAGFAVTDTPDRVADFGIASGIYNVRGNCPNEAWLQHIEASIDLLARTSRHGFAFNCLTSYSDPPKMRPHLYYADPCYIFDLCKRRYSRQVALLHDYGLYEFTILVRIDA